MPLSESPYQTAFPGARVLIVDDERALRHSLAGLFERIGYQTWEAASGAEALQYLQRREYDVVLLDLKMPGMDGTEVLQRAGALAPDALFIIMTAYGTLDSAILGIRQGAFDYLLKPSPVKEIVRVVEAGLTKIHQQRQAQEPVQLLERALATLKSEDDPLSQSLSPAPEESKGRFLEAPGLLLDRERELVLLEGEPLDLTPTEFEILVYLMHHQNCVVSASEIVAHLRGYEIDERDARTFLRAHIHRLRQKVEADPQNPRLIGTVYGRGFRLPAEPAPSTS
jgi:DNA-binding response OmpR family regulator